MQEGDLLWENKAPNEVYDALREGQTVIEVAKKFGISRASVYKLTEGGGHP